MRQSATVANGFIILGSLLIALGVAGFVLSRVASPTALIPAFLGLPIAASGLVARRAKRPLGWHVLATLLTLFGVAGSLRGLAQLPALLGGAALERPLAVAVQSAMALICIAFLIPLIARLSTLRFPDGRFDGR